MQLGYNRNKACQLKTGFLERARRLLVHVAARLRLLTSTGDATCKPEHAANVHVVPKRHTGHPAGTTIHRILLVTHKNMYLLSGCSRREINLTPTN